jgi:hypothetical protein
VEYDAFPPVPEEDWQGSELGHAMTLAGVLGGLVTQAGLSAEAPIQEDFGAVLPVVVQDRTVFVTISYYPAESSDFTWRLQFEEGRSILRIVFGRRDPGAAEKVTKAVWDIVQRHPDRFRHAEWVGPAHP